jgi:hypothetical protein
LKCLYKPLPKDINIELTFSGDNLF